MPKYRSIHTKITQSFDVNDMPDDFTRLVWVMLPLGLDCEGRGIYDFSWIKSKIFPLRKDISEKKLKKSLDWFISRKNPDTKLGMIEIYSVDGREYFYVPNFKTYQRGLDKEAPSILPAPPVAINSVSTPDLLPTKLPLKADADADSQADANAEAVPPTPDDNSDNAWISSETIAQFEEISGLTVPHTTQESFMKWVEALRRLNKSGADKDIQLRAIQELSEKKYRIAGPWSIEKACGMILAEKRRETIPKTRARDSEGEFAEHIRH